MTLYRSLLGIDAVALGIAVYFFLWGLSDGTVSSFNIGTWLMLLVPLMAIVWGGIALRRAGRMGAAKVLLALLAVPSAGAALFVVLLILSNPRWN